MAEQPRRRVPGIGWLYIAIIVAIVRIVSGPWRFDGGWLLVFVFAFIGTCVYFEAARGLVDSAADPQDDES